MGGEPLTSRGQNIVIIAVWMGRMTQTSINLSEAIRLNMCRATIASHRNLAASLAEGIPASILCAHRILDNQKKKVDTNNAQRKKKHTVILEPMPPFPSRRSQGEHLRTDRPGTRTRQSARAYPRAPFQITRSTTICLSRSPL
jgi:hypothetical protein